jgi:phosphate transport system substrate-binding protein
LTTDAPRDSFADPDLKALPVVAYPIVPAYYIPELSGQKETLVFDLQTIADILYGRITKWNDASIKALNTDLQDLLPDASITVVVTTDAALENLLLTTALNESVPNWGVTKRLRRH